MAKDQLYDVWWQDAAQGEQPMEDTHLRFWQKVLSMVTEKDLSNFSVLDVGCNQGGFLRYLYGQRPFKNGIGVDLARRSVEVANARKGNLPLHYEATTTPEQFAHQFDLAFSISVIYLIPDLQEHAWKIKQALMIFGRCVLSPPLRMYTHKRNYCTAVNWFVVGCCSIYGTWLVSIWQKGYICTLKKYFTRPDPIDQFPFIHIGTLHSPP